MLPCVLDVGTNNAALAADPWYMGLQQPRLTGDAYLEVVDEVGEGLGCGGRGGRGGMGVGGCELWVGWVGGERGCRWWG